MSTSTKKMPYGEHFKVDGEPELMHPPYYQYASVYSNGLSEVILGNAIKKLKLPREEIVVMTKVYGSVAPKYGMNLLASGQKPEDIGIIQQKGLNRKVRVDCD
ncbi:hypothetical protein EIP86_011418 [Pleurotus ostreatoroseus]|nr:hypothetical protein EIP86_011418 [Pleurotus ostreatoroseus]